jgi:hypothetical protein
MDRCPNIQFAGWCADLKRGVPSVNDYPILNYFSLEFMEKSSATWGRQQTLHRKPAMTDMMTDCATKIRALLNSANASFTIGEFRPATAAQGYEVPNIEHLFSERAAEGSEDEFGADDDDSAQRQMTQTTENSSAKASISVNTTPEAPAAEHHPKKGRGALKRSRTTDPGEGDTEEPINETE